ncbi:MAG: arsenate reductase family protein [Bdellovibrionales bacterium]|nr:arsenate reductase family protein [Bdellovibrionales bacterium]
MAKIEVYGYSKCSTCRKAYKYLDERGVQYNEVDITENAPSVAELKKVLKSYEGNLKRLFNTSGVAYRELKISDKLKTMSDQEAIDLLSKNGRLVKRPFIASSGAQLVGFKQEEWDEATF